MIQRLMQTYNRYLVSIFTISTLSLVINLVILKESPFTQIFFIITYVGLAIICLFFEKEYWYQGLMRMQIYLLVPSIVTFSLTNYHFPSSHILNYLLFILTNLVCMAQFKKCQKFIEINNEFKISLVFSSVTLTLFIALGIYQAKTAQLLLVSNSLFLFLLTSSLILEPKKALSTQINQDMIGYIYISTLIATLILQYFVPHNHLVQLIYAFVYIVVATNLCFVFREKRLIFVLICVLLLLYHFFPNKIQHSFDLTLMALIILLWHVQSAVLYEVTSSFGKLSVLYDYKFNKIMMRHNDILHGEQYYYGNTRHAPNFCYYGNTKDSGPIYKIFNALDAKGTHHNIACLGLGIGIVSSYGKEGQNMTFYELNPDVKAIATNSKYFTFLATCKAKLSFIIGDARKNLVKAKNHEYGLIFIDVYNGWSIPRYFLTAEAINLYLSKINTQGLIVIHITTKDKDLESIIGKVTKELNLCAYTSYIEEDIAGDEEALAKTGLIWRKKNVNWQSRLYRNLLTIFGLSFRTSRKNISQWVVIARKEDHLLGIPSTNMWHPLVIKAEQALLADADIDYELEARGTIISTIL